MIEQKPEVSGDVSVPLGSHTGKASATAHVTSCLEPGAQVGFRLAPEASGLRKA